MNEPKKTYFDNNPEEGVELFTPDAWHLALHTGSINDDDGAAYWGTMNWYCRDADAFATPKPDWAEVVVYFSK